MRLPVPQKLLGLLGALGRALLVVACARSAFAERAAAAAYPAPTLSLGAAVQIAQREDPWLAGNRHSQEAVAAASVAAGALPDPEVAVGLLNVPTDTFDFNQEAMTQFRVGIAQSFPRGKSRQLKARQLAIQGQQYPYQRQNRRARVAVTVGELWLDLFKAQESIALIEENRVLFDQLAAIVVASYTSAAGRTRQQDVIRAELELTQLEDRLTVLAEQRASTQLELAKWLHGGYSAAESPSPWSAAGLRVPRQLPAMAPTELPGHAGGERERVVALLMRHPAVVALDQKIAASGEGVALAQQKYKPQWGVNASYGYRDDDPQGIERADFFSVGVTLDLPLFTANRQDRDVQSAAAAAEAVKAEKWLLLRDMLAAYQRARAQWVALDQRQRLYRQRLLPQIARQAKASLVAYTHDDGDFAEVVRARIGVLNARIEALVIAVERQKTLARLNYFMVRADGAARSATAAPAFAGEGS